MKTTLYEHPVTFWAEELELRDNDLFDEKVTFQSQVAMALAATGAMAKFTGRTTLKDKTEIVYVTLLSENEMTREELVEWVQRNIFDEAGLVGGFAPGVCFLHTVAYTIERVHYDTILAPSAEEAGRIASQAHNFVRVVSVSAKE